ncbi:MAG: hypothetical protein ACR2OH_03875 [Microthrixaceae bacterium]
MSILTRTAKIAAAGLALTVAGTTTSVLGAPGAAGAASGDSNGVNYVNFDPNPYICEFNALPTCLPDHGNGKSNAIYVHQSLVDGEYRFTHLSGTSTDTDDVWMQTGFSAQCGTSFRLNAASMRNGGTTGASTSADGAGLGDGDVPWPQPVNHSNRTIPFRNVALHQDVNDFADAHWGADDVLQWGEDKIAMRMEAGHSEEGARSLGHIQDQIAILSATVKCRKITGFQGLFGRVDWRTTAGGHPVEIVYLPIGAEPGDEQPNWRDAVLPEEPTRPGPGPGRLTEGFHVNAVTLSALEDEGDACLLHLSGTITTNGPGGVSYRFVDELGHKSQVFNVDVDLTQVAMLDNHIELEPIALGTGLHAVGGAPGELTAHDDGEIGGYAAEEGDNVQGYFYIEVFSPHMAESNIASYNVDGCTTGGTQRIPATRG